MAIVCGTDFSDHAASALSAAGALATRLRDRELWLVHVLDGALANEIDPVEWVKRMSKTAERSGA